MNMDGVKDESCDLVQEFADKIRDMGCIDDINDYLDSLLAQENGDNQRNQELLFDARQTIT